MTLPSLIVTLLLCLSLGPLLPGFLSSLFSVAHCLAPAPLKLRPYGAIQNTFIIIIIIFKMAAARHAEFSKMKY